MNTEGNLALKADVAHDVQPRNSARLEQRYAQALYELASEQKVLSSVEKDVSSLSAAITSAADLKKALSHPLIGREQQQRVLQAIASKLEANALTQKFLALVCKKKRQAEFVKIATAFKDLCAAARGEVTADVRSAATLSPAQQEELARVLSAKHKAKVKLNIVVDPSLLGGLTVKIGGTLYDRTLGTQLARLEDQLETAA